VEEKKPIHPGLSYCVDCKTVKFEAEVVPKEALQKHEIAEPTDGSFWAFCRVCKSIEGINLLAGFLGIPLAGTTKHRALKAALHVPFMDPDGIRREPMHVEVEERTAPVAPTATPEPRKAPEAPESQKTP
jgi:hypothetical protein